MVDVLTCLMKFDVRHRTRGEPERFAVHPHHQADAGVGVWKNVHNVIALVIQCRAIDLDKTDIVSPSFKTKLTEPCGIQRWQRFPHVHESGQFMKVFNGRVVRKLRHNVSP